MSVNGKNLNENLTEILQTYDMHVCMYICSFKIKQDCETIANGNYSDLCDFYVIEVCMFSQTKCLASIMSNTSICNGYVNLVGNSLLSISAYKMQQRKQNICKQPRTYVCVCKFVCMCIQACPLNCGYKHAFNNILINVSMYVWSCEANKLMRAQFVSEWQSNNFLIFSLPR